MEAKIKGMESYKFEKRMYPHPSSPEALKNLSHRYGIMGLYLEEECMKHFNLSVTK